LIFREVFVKIASVILVSGGVVQSKLTEIISENSGGKGSLIPILQKVQEQLGYLSEEAISEIAKVTGISASEIFGVASFYAQFYFTPRGKHMVKACLGTACHVRGGERILEEIKRELNIEAGNTTEDHNFSLERVACFGSCALAPLVVVDKDVYGRMNVAKVKDILSLYHK
jgi:NADH-quinone oxidoreductase subunit E